MGERMRPTTLAFTVLATVVFPSRALAACAVLPLAKDIHYSGTAGVNQAFAWPTQPIEITIGKTCTGWPSEFPVSPKVVLHVAGHEEVLKPKRLSSTKLQVVIPETDRAGRAKLVVHAEDDSELATVDELWIDCDKSEASTFVGFTILPAPNRLRTSVEAKPILAATDGAGGLLIPVEHGSFSPGAAKVEYGWGWPGLMKKIDAAVAADRLSGLAVYDEQGWPLPPVFRADGNGGFSGAADAPSSVLRIPNVDDSGAPLFDPAKIAGWTVDGVAQLPQSHFGYCYETRLDATRMSSTMTAYVRPGENKVAIQRTSIAGTTCPQNPDVPVEVTAGGVSEMAVGEPLMAMLSPTGSGHVLRAFNEQAQDQLEPELYGNSGVDPFDGDSVAVAGSAIFFPSKAKSELSWIRPNMVAAKSLGLVHTARMARARVLYIAGASVPGPVHLFDVNAETSTPLKVSASNVELSEDWGAVLTGTNKGLVRFPTSDTTQLEASKLKATSASIESHAGGTVVFTKKAAAAAKPLYIWRASDAKPKRVKSQSALDFVARGSLIAFRDSTKRLKLYDMANDRLCDTGRDAVRADQLTFPGLGWMKPYAVHGDQVYFVSGDGTAGYTLNVVRYRTGSGPCSTSASILEFDDPASAPRTFVQHLPGGEVLRVEPGRKDLPLQPAAWLW